MKEKTDNVLICPLNWGLGHAARCIPIIRELILMHKKVVVAGHGKSLTLLKLEFPGLDFVELSGVEINYGTSGFSLAAMLLQFPKMIRSVYKEHRQLKQIINEKNIHLVISDNRFGCWSDSVKSIFITHQLFIKLPSRWRMLTRLVNAVNHYFINKYDECWVPDENSDPNLSGELSHGNSQLSNVKFIGTLSRFNLLEKEKNNSQYEVLVILSGP